MTFDADDDLDLVYSADGETTAATLTISSVESTIYGFYDRTHEALDMDSMSVSSAGPRFRCQSAPLASFNRKIDTITISGTPYVVKAIEPIGSGADCYVVLGDEATVVSDTTFSPGAATDAPRDSITITADYTVVCAPGTIIFINATAGAINVTMPAAADFEGYTHTLTRIDSTANVVTVLAASGETINEAASVVIVGQDSRDVYSDGTELRLT